MRIRFGVPLLLLVALAGCIPQPPVEPDGRNGSTAATATTSIAGTPPPRPGAVLAPPSYRLAPMPISPTWRPPGTDVRPALLYTAYLMRYPVGELELLVTYEDPTQREIGPRGESTPVTMLDAEAGEYVVPFGHQLYTVWSLTDPDGLWVVVSGTDSGMVRQFAQGLRREPVELAAPFEVALLPEGFVPIRVDRYTMDFSDTNVVGGGEYVSIQLLASDQTLDDWPSTPAMVNGHPAEVFVAVDSSIRVMVSLPGGAALRVEASAGLNLDQGQILRLAEGVTVTEHAVPWVNP